MEVGDALHASRHVPGPGHLAVGLLLVVVVAQDEAQQQPWHNDVSDSQHGEVTSCRTAAEKKTVKLLSFFFFHQYSAFRSVLDS